MNTSFMPHLVSMASAGSRNQARHPDPLLGQVPEIKGKGGKTAGRLRIGLITTLNTNIGDDFIRTGVCALLRQVFEGRDLEFVAINKHDPYTAYHWWQPIRLTRLVEHLPRGKWRVRRWIESRAAWPASNRFDDCDVIVQCGAPVLWPECHLCEWAEPLWHGIVGPLHERVPVLNLAAGSCFPWEQQPVAITDSGDAKYLRAIHGYCRLTTARESLTQSLFKGLGCDVPQIPCSALLAAGDARGTGNDDGLVLINYMPGGGHYDFDQRVDGQSWHEVIKTLVERLATRHKVAFLCHNEKEAKAASELAGGIPRLWPKTVAEYFSIVAQAKGGVFNRMHASVALAGMGIPSVAIGTDTRLLMVGRLDLPHLYVKEASSQRLEQEIENLLTRREEERDRLIQLRQETWQAYLKCMSEALSQVQ